MKKKIMLLASNFPPYDGGRIGSSIRVYTMAEFLAKNGYIVHVVIPKRFVKNREEPVFHRNITIHKYFSPFHYYDHSKKLPLFHWVGKCFLSAMKKILQKFFVNIVDLYIPLIVFFCKKIIIKQSISIIISSSPPLYVLSLADLLKKQLKEKIFWISDLRDISFIHPTGKKKSLLLNRNQQKVETKLIGLSDRIFVVSEGMKNILFNNQVDIYKRKIMIVENGYSDVEFKEPQREFKNFVEKARLENRIIILYAGTGVLDITNSKLGKNKKLNCFVDLLTNDKYLSEKYALILQGVIKNTDDYFLNLQTKLKYLILPPVNNDVMRANMLLSDIGINLNVDKEYAPLIMGGKVYDYCISGLALILVFPENADSLKDFSRKHDNKPYFADVFDKESIKKVFKDIVDNPDELSKRRFTKKEMEPHSRDNQYKKILKIL